MAGIKLQGVFQRTRQHDGYPFHISKADCESDDDLFNFTVVVDQPDINTGTLQIWASTDAGNDCTQQEIRLIGKASTTPDDDACQMVADLGTPTNVNVPIELASSEIADKIAGVTYEAGTCTDTTEMPAPRQVLLWVMLVQGGGTGNVDAAYTVKFPQDKYDIYVDLVGPPPPADITVSPSEESLQVGLETPSTVTDIAGHYIYCDPPPVESSDSAGAGCGCLNIGETGTGGDAGSSSTTGNGNTTTGNTTTSTTTGAGATGSTGGTGGMATTGGMGGTGGGMAGTGGMGGMGGTGGGMAGTGGTGGGTGGMAAAGAAGGTGGATGGSGTGAAGGTGGTAGAGGAEACVENVNSETGTCTSCTLREGEQPPGDAYKCGTIQGTGSSGLAAVLENGRYNAVAVAAFDRIGNVGPLSVSRCATPIEVQDFYEDYRDRGGKAGGGLCSVQSQGQSRSKPFSAAGPLFGALAGAAFLLRRRRRSRRPEGGPFASHTAGGAR